MATLRCPYCGKFLSVAYYKIHVRYICEQNPNNYQTTTCPKCGYTYKIRGRKPINAKPYIEEEDS